MSQERAIKNQQNANRKGQRSIDWKGPTINHNLSKISKKMMVSKAKEWLSKQQVGDQFNPTPRGRERAQKYTLNRMWQWWDSKKEGGFVAQEFSIKRERSSEQQAGDQFNQTPCQRERTKNMWWIRCDNCGTAKRKAALLRKSSPSKRSDQVSNKRATNSTENHAGERRCRAIGNSKSDAKVRQICCGRAMEKIVVVFRQKGKEKGNKDGEEFPWNESNCGEQRKSDDFTCRIAEFAIT